MRKLMVQPIRLLGGWQELSQGLCIVLAVHSACAVAGLLLHWVLVQATRGMVLRWCLELLSLLTSCEVCGVAGNSLQVVHLFVAYASLHSQVVANINTCDAQCYGCSTAH